MKYIHCSLLLVLALVASSLAWGADTNHNFAKWEGEISAFERLDATNPPPRGALLFIGSSTIRLWKSLASDFPGLPVVNRGFGGSEIVDSTHFARRIVFPYAPAKIFFRAGGNDLAAGKTPEQVFADFKEFVELVRTRLPQTPIIYIGWNPTPLRWAQHEQEKTLNGLVAGYVREHPYLQYVETYDLVLGPDGQPRAELFLPDRLHFNAAGYQLLAGRVRPFVLK